MKKNKRAGRPDDARSVGVVGESYTSPVERGQHGCCECLVEYHRGGWEIGGLQ